MSDTNRYLSRSGNKLNDDDMKYIIDARSGLDDDSNFPQSDATESMLDSCKQATNSSVSFSNQAIQQNPITNTSRQVTNHSMTNSRIPINFESRYIICVDSTDDEDEDR